MFKPNYPLLTQRLKLRPYVNQDFTAYASYYAREDVAQYLYWEVGDEQKLRDAFNKRKAFDTIDKDNDSLVLAIELSETNNVIGESILILRNKEHQQGELGYVIHPDFAGQGYAKEASHALLKVGFGELKLHRIYARCDARNTPSYKLMEALGMRKEAHFIHHEKFKGEWAEEVYYALLKTEWEAMQNL